MARTVQLTRLGNESVSITYGKLEICELTGVACSPLLLI